jgi:hypothetical protein
LYASSFFKDVYSRRVESVSGPAMLASSSGSAVVVIVSIAASSAKEYARRAYPPPEWKMLARRFRPLLRFQCCAIGERSGEELREELGDAGTTRGTEDLRRGKLTLRQPFEVGIFPLLRWLLTETEDLFPALLEVFKLLALLPMMRVSTKKFNRQCEGASC